MYKCICNTPDWKRGTVHSDPQCSYCVPVDTNSEVATLRPTVPAGLEDLSQQKNFAPLAVRRDMLIVSCRNMDAYMVDIDEAFLRRVVGDEAVNRAAVIFITEPTANVGRVFRSWAHPDEMLIVSTAAIG